MCIQFKNNDRMRLIKRVNIQCCYKGESKMLELLLIAATALIAAICIKLATIIYDWGYNDATSESSTGELEGCLD